MPGSGGVFENSLSSPSGGPWPPTSSGAAKAFVRKPRGREAPCWPVHLTGGPANASRQHRLGSPSWGCQPAPHPRPLLPTPQLCRFLEPRGFGPSPGWRMAGSPGPRTSHTPPFTRWHRSRGNARRQLGTSAGLCPPPAQSTSARGEGQAAPKKPLQDGALEILSTNYESRDKQGICKSISDRTFPGKRFIQALLKPGPHAGSPCPSSCPCPAQSSGTVFRQPLSRGARTRSGLDAGGQGRALRRSAGGPSGAVSGAGPDPRVHCSSSPRLAGAAGRARWTRKETSL